MSKDDEIFEKIDRLQTIINTFVQTTRPLEDGLKLIADIKTLLKGEKLEECRNCGLSDSFRVYRHRTEGVTVLRVNCINCGGDLPLIDIAGKNYI
jgi:hypothetical protein